MRVDPITHMSAHVLLNLSNELRKRDKMRDLSSILSLFTTSLLDSYYRSKNVRFYWSYDIILILKSYF